MRAKNRQELPSVTEWMLRVTLVVVSTVLAVAVLELGCRLHNGSHWLLHWPNLVAQEVAAPPPGGYVHDPVLGFVPKPGFASAGFSFDDLGNRVVPSLGGVAGGAPVLVTGASFAFGDEVGNDHSWPAYLQSLIGRRTVNAGVNAYGLDQTVLRTERKSASLRPALIILSFDSESLERSELRRESGVLKPYFTVDDDGELALHNVPVPNEHAGGKPRPALTFWQRTFGWSHLVDMIMRRLGLALQWLAVTERATPDGTAERLACPLMERLAGLRTPTLVVAQYAPDYWEHDDAEERVEERTMSRGVLACAAEAGLATFDTFDVIDRTVRERGLEYLYLEEHHSPGGNRVIAEAIAAELERRRLLK